MKVKAKEYELDIYSNGLVYCSVCTNAPRKEVVAVVNEHNPTGLEHSWHISKENFRTGEPNPHACEQHPKTHKHYLMEC